MNFLGKNPFNRPVLPGLLKPIGSRVAATSGVCTDTGCGRDSAFTTTAGAIYYSKDSIW